MDPPVKLPDKLDVAPPMTDDVLDAFLDEKKEEREAKMEDNSGSATEVDERSIQRASNLALGEILARLEQHNEMTKDYQKLFHYLVYVVILLAVITMQWGGSNRGAHKY